MALGENKYILEKIQKNKRMEIITKNEFETILNKIKISNIVLIAVNQALQKFFGRKITDVWIPKWHYNFPKEFSDESIDGVYKWGNRFISVFSLYVSIANSSNIFILDKTKIGKFIQYSPLGKKMKSVQFMKNF